MTFLSDVEKLKKSPSLEIKQQVTEKITQYFNQGVFDKDESKLALEVMGLLAHDAEVKIRQTLSENLKNNTEIPHSLAMRLAQDVAEVSVPMLSFSSLLSQEDLIKIVKTTKEIAALNAIAVRDDVSAPLSGALIDTSQEVVVNTLISNRKADVADDQMKNVLDKYAKSGSIIDALVSRGQLPASIVDQMLESFLQKFSNDPQSHVVEYIVEALKKQHVIDAAAPVPKDDVDEYRITQEQVDMLFEKDELNSSRILRALCKGEFLFMEMAFAKITGATQDRIHKILYTQGAGSFAAVYKKAGMPEGTFGAVNVIWKFVLDELAKGTFDKKTYANRMIEYITENGYDTAIEFMQYFMILFKSKADE